MNGLKNNFCCEELEFYTTEKEEEFSDPDKLIYHGKTFDEFGIIIHDGGKSYVAITHCPWSGDKLPNSKRLQWFEELEALGYEDPIGEFEQLPRAYKSDEWFK